MSSFFDTAMKFMLFNAENFFVRMDRFDQTSSMVSEFDEKTWQKQTASIVKNKPIRDLLEVKRIIDEVDPDFILLCEVGGLESLVNYCKHFLPDRYIPQLIEGNSPRGIDVGFLVRRSLPLEFEIRSHKDRALDLIFPHEVHPREVAAVTPEELSKPHRFSRDVAELRLYLKPKKNESKPKKNEPGLVILMTHLKSRLDRDRIDPGGSDRRGAELSALVDIFHETQSSFGGRVPVVVAGDFNGRVSPENYDAEFAPLYEKTNLVESLAAAGVLEKDRCTYVQVQRKATPNLLQFDYVFMTPDLIERIDPEVTKVYRFRDWLGRERDLPRSLADKRLLPSDHYPVIVGLRPRT